MVEIRTERTAAATTLRVSGEVDVSNADELRAAGLQALGDRKPVRMDLERVGFIDSTALGALVAVRREALAEGLDFRVTAAHPQARRVMEITGLDEFLAPPG